MKAELTFSPETIKAIAFEVAEILKPILFNNVPGVADELLNTNEAAKLLKGERGTNLPMD